MIIIVSTPGEDADRYIEDAEAVLSESHGVRVVRSGQHDEFINTSTKFSVCVVNS